jgi:thiamine phosphate synthase YjbQ (UPF0047 family)
LTTLRSQGIGDVPVGLNPQLREYLRKLKDAIEILTGSLQNQLESSNITPGSQAVTFDDLSSGASVSDETEDVTLIDRINALESQTANIKSFINDHEDLEGNDDDDHPGYLWLLGRSGGQIAYGGTGSGDDLLFKSTSHATKGDIVLGESNDIFIQGSTGRVGIFTNTPGVELDIVGSCDISTNLDVDGITNLDIVDIDDYVQVNVTDSIIGQGLSLTHVQSVAAALSISIASVLETTHAAGTVNLGIGYFGGFTGKSNGALGEVRGVSGTSKIDDTFTPTVTLMVGVNGSVDAEDATVTAAASIRAEDPEVDGGSIGAKWGIYSQGDVQLDSDKKLILEGNIVTKGDSYLVFNSATTDMDLFVDAVKVHTWDDDGSVIHKKFTASAGRIEAVSQKTANYTLTASDYGIVADTSGGAFTLTLPAAPETGRVYSIVLETAGNALTVDGNGKNIIGNATIDIIFADDAMQLEYNGTQWSLI